MESKRQDKLRRKIKWGRESESVGGPGGDVLRREH